MPTDGLAQSDVAATPAAASSRLRIVAFTGGPLSPINRRFFERLAADPLLDLRGIIVDEYERPRTSVVVRLRRSLRREGWPWLWFKALSTMESLGRRMAVCLFERAHPRTWPEESYDHLERQTGVQVHRVADIHDDASLALIRALRVQLGLIVGGRILRDSVVSIPEFGTLNVHKRKVPEYRGGGPVGYWEILAGETSIGVTIHYATAELDAGPVLAETSIPIEECDTLESLRIKADLVGARLYHDTIRRFALGARQGIAQDPGRTRTYRSPSDFAVWQLERRLKQRATRMMPTLQARPSRAARTRVLIQYAMLLPWLLRCRKQFIRQRRAPIGIYFYHVVGNRPINHMCLPLEEFVKQIEFLRRYFAVLSLDEAVGRLRLGHNEQLAAAITFDDGYQENMWAIEYLRYFGIPASFFVSIGHVGDGTPFEHDRRRGFEQARPMLEPDVSRLASDGFIVGSHGLYHEDFGTLDSVSADRTLRESRVLIEQVCGRAPEHFSFPKGQRTTNITAESFALATKHYRFVYSAYGGHNFPCEGRQHFLRLPNRFDVLELAMDMDGYMGLRECVTGNAWGLRTHALAPY